MRDWQKSAVHVANVQAAQAAKQARARALMTRILSQVPRMSARDVVAAWETFEQIERTKKG